MKTWTRAVRDGAISGAGASIASALILAVRGRQENGHPAAPINAVSHWIWDDLALRENSASARFTVVGYVIHHCAALFWAVPYEKLLAKPTDSLAKTLGNAALTSAVACVVDLRFTPRRLTPGYERRLSNKSLLFVYSAFALGLAAASVLNNTVSSRTRE